MSLSLGSVFATVDLETAAFDVKYAAVMRKFAELGRQAERAAAGTGALDKSLAGTGKSSTALGMELARLDATLQQTNAAAARAAGGTTELGLAQSKAATGNRALEAAQLRLVAATERLSVVQAKEGASVGELASAQASLITALDRVVAVQARDERATLAAAAAKDKAAVAAERQSAAVAAAAERQAQAVAAAAAREAQAATVAAEREARAAELVANAQRVHAAAAARVTSMLGPEVDVTTELGAAQSKLTQATLRQAAAQERLSALEASGTASTRTLAAAQASLVAASDRAAIAQNRLAKTSTWPERYRSAAGPLAVTGALITASFIAAGKAAAHFDSEMALNESLLRASAKNSAALSLWMGQLREQALSAGQAFGFTAGEVARAQGELIKAGISVQDILGGALVGALTLAAAGQEDVAHATETAAIAMTQFKLKGQDVPHIADLLAAGADRALGSVSDLSEALKYGGLASAQAGESIENTIGTLAELAQAGQIGSIAGTGLTQMLQNLQKPSNEAAAVMDHYTLSLYNADGTTKSYTQIAGMLHDALMPLPDAERASALATLFTARARRTATVLTRDGAAANKEWTDTVNVSGFAALQAAGKLNSLTGDWIKLKAALSSALIGSGAGTQGPLRELVQDATAIIEAWEKIPAPLRATAEVMIAVAGAASLAGAAALVAVPKWVALQEAMANTRLGAVGARGAFAAIGKATLAAGAIVGVVEGAKALGHVFADDVKPSVEETTASMIKLASTGDDATDSMIRFLTSSGAGAINSLGALDDMLENVDQSLADLVTGGHLDIAQKDFAKLSAALRRGGMSTDDITKLFPLLSAAMSDSANSAELAGDGVDQYGNAVSDAAKKTKDATEAAKAYADQLHAASDPLFALSQALSDVRDKQDAATKAIHKYGDGSRQAREKNDELFQSMVSAQDAAVQLTGAVKSGAVSMRNSRAMTDAFQQSLGLTKGQASSLTDQIEHLIDRSASLNRQRPHLKVTAEVDQAQAAINSVINAIRGATSHVWTFLVNTVTGGGPKPPGRAAGGGAPDGLFAVGEQGPELAYKSGSQVHIFSNAQSRALIGATGMRVPGFAGGTGDLAIARVLSAIAASVRPDVTDPHRLSSMLGRASAGAVSDRAAAMRAREAYQAARDHAKALDEIAKNADKAAHAAKRHADAMKDDTAKEKAAKKSAEEHAKALQKTANAADKTARQADHAADRSKNAWDKLGQAADKATQKATADAQQLVSVLSSSIDDMQSKITDFEGQVSSGLTGDYSLASIWSGLVDTQQQAASDLASALSTYQDAQDALTQAGTDATTDQLKAVTDAQNALTAAQAAADQANAAVSTTGVQSSLNSVMASAQKFAGDLQTLVGEGASSTLISQLVAMGPQAGDALASQLVAAGADSITQLSSTLDQIASYASSVADSFGSQFADSLTAPFYPGGVSAMDDFIKGLVQEFPELAKALGPLLSSIDDMLADVGVGGGSSAHGSVPHFANGVRDFAGGLALVGEYGPEYVTLPHGANVYPHGSDGASMPLTRLDPVDRALLRTVAQRMGDGIDAMENRPVQLKVNEQVLGESANNYRQWRRRHGDPKFR